MLSLCVESASAQRKENARVMGLVELYGLSASIVHGDEDQLAANLLLEFLRPNLRELKTVPAKGSKNRDDDVVFYLGSFDKNLPAAKAFKSFGYSLNWDALSEGSFLLKTFRKGGKTTIFVAGKDRQGTLYAAQELKNYYLRTDMGRVLLNELSISERAQLKYRWFRLTDRDTESRVKRAIADTAPAGSSGQPSDPAQLKAVVDYLSTLRLNGLLLHSFPGVGSTGVAAVQDLCAYAAERAVRILPRIGLNGWDGPHSDGDRTLNLDSWAKAHRELCAVGRNGSIWDGMLCPEKPENRQRYREGLQWLFQTARVGGVSIELEPFFVCYSEDCKKARLAMGGADPDYSKDLARFVGFLAEEILKLDPSAWVAYLSGTGFDYESIQASAARALPPGQRAAFPPEFVHRIPESAVAEWELAPMLKSGVWPSPFRAPGKHGLGVLQWGGSAAKEIYWKRTESITHHAIASNLEGLVISGGGRSDNPFSELNDLVFAELAFNPAVNFDELFRFKVSRLYGGEEAARRLSKILALLEDEKGMLVANYDEALRSARQAAEVSERSGKERWAQLVELIQSLKR